MTTHLGCDDVSKRLLRMDGDEGGNGILAYGRAPSALTDSGDIVRG